MFEGLSVKDWLEVAAIIFGGGALAYSVWDMKGDMKDIKADLKLLNNVSGQMALNQQAQRTFEIATNETIREMRMDLRELKRGEGFIGEPFIRSEGPKTQR